MTLCPVALAVGCRKCPIFSICPATSILGDQPSKSAEPPAPASAGKGKSKGKKASK